MRNREKIFWLAFLLLLLGVANPLFAQLTRDENLSRFDDRPLHFGFYLGINTMDYRFSHYNDVMQNPVFVKNPGLDQQAEKYYNGVHSYRVESYPLKPGFTVGGVVNLRMNRVIDFRFTPGMSLGVRQLIFSNDIDQYIKDPQIGGTLHPESTYERYLTTPSAYIDFPVGVQIQRFQVWQPEALYLWRRRLQTGSRKQTDFRKCDSSEQERLLC